MFLEYIVNNEKSIREVLIVHYHFSNRYCLHLKINNNIYLNDDNQLIYLDKVVNNGDKVSIKLDDEENNCNILPKFVPLDILYEDDYIIALNKPPHMPVHPSLEHFDDSLSNGLKFYFDSINLKRKIRPINRLDKDTSGIVLFAKFPFIQYSLQNYNKEYITIVNGRIENDGVIDKPIARKNNSIIERCVSDEGKNAITEYKVLKNFSISNKEYTMLRCILHTGRTHQIRVHFRYIGHSILGDTLYGEKSNLIDRQALHASKITFLHPVTKKEIMISCTLPDDMKKIIESV